MFIYTLHDPVTDEIRYVGQTVKTKPRNRFLHHRHCAAKGVRTHLYNWWRSLPAEPVMKLLPMTMCKPGLDILEKHYIAEFRVAGARLCNQTNGGDGTVGFSRKGQKGTPHTEATKRKLSEINTGKRYGDGYK